MRASPAAWPARAVGLVGAILVLGGVGAAQDRVALRLGLADQAVAEAWNRVVLEVRDLPGAVLRLEMDAGSLRAGEVPQRLTWTMPSSGGLQRREGDLYLPAWRSLTWRVEHGDRLVASGSVGPREREARALDLILSTEPGRWRGAYPDAARLVGVAARDLPLRAAPYDGVRSLLVDGTAAAPRAEALLAAAAAGVRVMVVEPLGAGHVGLAPLLEGGGTAVGAGGIRALRADGGTPSLPELPEADGGAPRRALWEAFVAAAERPTWTHRGVGGVALAGATYTTLVLLLIRAGRGPGLLSAAMLAGAATVGATLWLAPDDPTPRAERTLSIGSGAVAYRAALLDVSRLPAGEAEVAGSWRALGARRLRWADGDTVVPMRAAESVRLAGAPTVGDPPLSVEAGTVVDRSGRGWDGAWVAGAGAGAVGPVPVDDAVAVASAEGPPPDDWAAIAERLPGGAALAWRGDALAVALPPGATWSGFAGVAP